MGTFVAIEAIAADADTAAHAIQAAFGAIDRVAIRMHPDRDGSDLARINAAPLNTPVCADKDILALLQLAVRLNELTEGVFDPCRPDRPGRLHDIVIEGNRLVCRKPVVLDFGGFAKGFAVDRAIEVLRRLGCVGGLVNAGGDLRVLGMSRDPILIRGTQGGFAQIDLENAALAVSDVDASDRPVEHQGYYLREPDAGLLGLSNRSGSRRSNPRQSDAGRSDPRHADPRQSDPRHSDTPPPLARHAAVVAPEAVVADALTKCVLLCPEVVASRAARAFGASRVVLTRPVGATP